MQIKEGLLKIDLSNPSLYLHIAKITILFQTKTLKQRKENLKIWIRPTTGYLRLIVCARFSVISLA